MVFGLILVNFMDGDDCVHNTGLHRLLLDHWLDILMHMMMNVFPLYLWRCAACMLRFSYHLLILKLLCFCFKSLGDMVIVAMLDVSVLNAPNLVSVRFWKHFFVLDGLNGGVVVVLVNFTVYCRGDVFVAGVGDVVMLDGGVDCLE